jgi:hypothetical protein
MSSTQAVKEETRVALLPSPVFLITPSSTPVKE